MHSSYWSSPRDYQSDTNSFDNYLILYVEFSVLIFVLIWSFCYRYVCIHTHTHTYRIAAEMIFLVIPYFLLTLWLYLWYLMLSPYLLTAYLGHLSVSFYWQIFFSLSLVIFFYLPIWLIFHWIVDNKKNKLWTLWILFFSSEESTPPPHSHTTTL